MCFSLLLRSDAQNGYVILSGFASSNGNAAYFKGTGLGSQNGHDAM
jgi:hypothetical protein